MTSTDGLAQILMALRRYDLGIDYLDRRNALIKAVTLADIKRVAERLYKPELMQIMVLGKDVQLPEAKKVPAPKRRMARIWSKRLNLCCKERKSS